MAGMLTRSDVIVRPQFLTTSPPAATAKSCYTAARVYFRRNTNTLLSSSGVNRGLVLSVPPHKLNNLNYYFNNNNNNNAPDSYLHLLTTKINRPVVVNNNQQSIINTTCDNNSSSVTDNLVEFKKSVVKTIASLMLFGFLAFMTTPMFRTSALAVSLSSSSSLPWLSSSSTPNSDCKVECDKIDNKSKPTSDMYEELWINIITIILVIILAPLTVPMFLAIIPGYEYYLALCKHTKEKSVLMLQVGVLDETRELQREVKRITQIASTSNLDGMELKGVVKALLQCYDSCRFAHLSVTQCISDEKKYENKNFAELMDSIDKDPEALIMVYDLFKYFAKSLAKFVHVALIKAIKKINYGDKCPKQLFAELLTRELAKYDKDEETLARVDGMKYEEEADGKAHSMVDNDYLVVTILVLASGVYSIPPLQCNTEHVKTVLQKFSSIPKRKIESLQVLLTPQTEDEGISEQGLHRTFPLLKPLTSSGLEKLTKMT